MKHSVGLPYGLHPPQNLVTRRDFTVPLKGQAFATAELTVPDQALSLDLLRFFFLMLT